MQNQSQVIRPTGRMGEYISITENDESQIENKNGSSKEQNRPRREMKLETQWFEPRCLARSSPGTSHVVKSKGVSWEGCKVRSDAIVGILYENMTIRL